MPEGWISTKYQNNLVSVIIPTYNRAKLLEQALESIKNQTYRPIECIVVDDGSTDNTFEVINSFKYYQADSFRIKYIKQTNSGAQHARNNGTVASTGEFIQYLDSDDLLYAEKLQQQVEYFKTHAMVDGVYGDWDKGLPDMKELIKGVQEADLLTQFIGKQCIHTLSFLFKRKAIGIIGPWDIEIKRNQEIDYHLRGVIEGCNFHYIPIHTGLWRTHDGERIANVTGLQHILFFFNKWLKIIESKQLLNEPLKKAISNKLFWKGVEYIDMPSQAKVVEAFRISYALDPTRAEFRTSTFRFIKHILGEVIAFRYLVFRIKIKNG
jgi:glycosyltransferase involved in cell wall biosynthesis